MTDLSTESITVATAGTPQSMTPPASTVRVRFHADDGNTGNILVEDGSGNTAEEVTPGSTTDFYQSDGSGMQIDATQNGDICKVTYITDA